MKFKDLFKGKFIKKLLRLPPVRVSLKLKLTLLMSVVLILCVWIISAFTIRYENEELESRLQDTMRVYLETFRKNVEILLIRKGDKESLNQFLDSYKNIKNFKMAMFVDNDGRMLIHTFPESLGKYVPASTLRKFRQAYEQKIYIDRYERTVEELPESIQITEFEKTVLNRIRSDKDKKAVLAVYEKKKESDSYELKDDVRKRDMTRAKSILESTGTMVWRGYDGFIPYYHPLIQSNTNEIREVINNIELYKQGFLFRNSIIPQEIYNDYGFVREFNRYYWAIFSGQDTNVETPVLRKRMAKYKLVTDDLAVMREMKMVFDEFRTGTDLTLDDDAFYNIIDVFKKMTPKQEALDPILSQRDRKMLFFHKDVLKPEVRNTLRFISFLEDFIFTYLDSRGKPTKKLDEFVSMFRGNPLDEMTLKYANVTSRNDYIAEFGDMFTKAYYYKYFQNIYRFYQKSVNYRYQDVDFRNTEVQKLFSDMMGIYRMGTVRIVLDHQKMQLDQKNVVNNTADIAMMIMIRVLIAAFIVISFLISPIGVLSKGADEIAKGNLDIVLKIPTGDEIGQLADKFNVMSASLKKAFAEVSDKARMEEELKNAKDIQEVILPRELPKLSGYSFSVHYKPQSESGGDYYDFIEVDRTHLGIVVADVTGHGVGAGMVMAMLRSSLRTFTNKKLDASKVLREVNPVLFRDTLPTMFATVFYGIVDHVKNEMLYTVAGHTQGIVFNPAQGKMKLLRTGGMPVGMVDSETFDAGIELYRQNLESGDILVLYSDGITEAKSAADEEYGDDRFMLAIRDGLSDDLDKMRDNIVENLSQFTGEAPQSDDITLLLVRVK